MLKVLALRVLLSGFALAQADGAATEAASTQEATVEHAEEAQEALAREENGLPPKEEAKEEVAEKAYWAVGEAYVQSRGEEAEYETEDDCKEYARKEGREICIAKGNE